MKRIKEQPTPVGIILMRSIILGCPHQMKLILASTKVRSNSIVLVAASLEFLALSSIMDSNSVQLRFDCRPSGMSSCQSMAQGDVNSCDVNAETTCFEHIAIFPFSRQSSFRLLVSC